MKNMTVQELIDWLSIMPIGERRTRTVYYKTKNSNEAQLKRMEICFEHDWINLVVEEKETDQ